MCKLDMVFGELLRYVKSKFIKLADVVANIDVKVKETKHEIDIKLNMYLELHKPIGKKFSNRQIVILRINDVSAAD